MKLIRTWFRAPDTATLAMAICGAAYAAVALGALGGFLGWQTAPPLPSNAEGAGVPALRDDHRRAADQPAPAIRAGD